MLCPNCGFESEGKFCPMCGAEFADKPQNTDDKKFDYSPQSDVQNFQNTQQGFQNQGVNPDFNNYSVPPAPYAQSAPINPANLNGYSAGASTENAKKKGSYKKPLVIVLSCLVAAVVALGGVINIYYYTRDEDEQTSISDLANNAVAGYIGSDYYDDLSDDYYEPETGLIITRDNDGNTYYNDSRTYGVDYETTTMFGAITLLNKTSREDLSEESYKKYRVRYGFTFSLTNETDDDLELNFNELYYYEDYASVNWHYEYSEDSHITLKANSKATVTLYATMESDTAIGNADLEIFFVSRSEGGETTYYDFMYNVDLPQAIEVDKIK